MVNWLGFRTLLFKAIRRFLKVWSQTLLAPCVQALIFLVIFTVAIGRSLGPGGVTYAEFLVPGLIMLVVLQNAFGNTSSSIMIAKVDGSIVDVLMPPLSPGELTFAYALGGAARGVAVAILAGLAMAIFVDVRILHPGFVIFHAIAAATTLSLVGIIVGIWAQKFDHMAATNHFIITPLTLISGSFYSVDRLTGYWHTLALLNPVFYLIDGFRYGFIGVSDAPVWIGVVLMLAVNALLILAAYQMFRTGYRLKA